MIGRTSRLQVIATEAHRRYTVNDLSDGWILSIESLVSIEWPHASRQDAVLLAEIMAVTPSTRWMWDYLIPAECGTIHNYPVLVENFAKIASAFAEAERRKDGLTQPG